MFKIRDSKKKHGSIQSGLYSDSEKGGSGSSGLLPDDIALGISNRKAYRNYRSFAWPLWLNEAADYFSSEYRSNPGPLLLNTNFREWQSFTNFLSDDEIHIDRSGMITGPGLSSWSLEFWVMSEGMLHYPQKNYRKIKALRDFNTGEIVFSGELGGSVFSQRIAGANYGVNEALVSYEFKAENTGSALFVVVRPYNSTSIGGISGISFNESTLRLKVNGVESIALDRKPEHIVTGNGLTGDIRNLSGDGAASVHCPDGMATLALVYDLKKGKNTLNLRLSLDRGKSIPDGKADFTKGFREFYNFSAVRLNEGLRIDCPDEQLTGFFNQAKITILTNNSADFNIGTADGCRNLYFFCYAMNRAGLDAEAEKLMNTMLNRLEYNPKVPELKTVIGASYLLDAFHECYIHRRDMDFLQGYYPEIRKIADYVYIFSTSVHSISDIPGGIVNNRNMNRSAENEFMILVSAMANASYLSRCMGIFGEEVKFKSESDRLQSIVRNSLEKKRASDSACIDDFYPLFAFPEALLSGYKKDDYMDILSTLSDQKYFPLFDNLAGIDLFSSAMLLVHMISLGDERFGLFYRKFFSLVDDFFILPEFMDPTTRRGVYGDGNLKITASLIFVIIRNMLILDRPDRLEIFPAPEKGWFEQGKKIKIENALTRYGRISMIMESLNDEIKITFPVLPKYIPSDILINIPVESSIFESDDFILKRKVGNSYIINGWPSVIRFSLQKRGQQQSAATLISVPVSN